jgi:hypothetical protein
MVTRPHTPGRWGRSTSRDFVLMLLVLFVFLVAATRLLGPDAAADPRTFGTRILATLLGLVQCFGLLIATGVLLALLESIKLYSARSHARRLEDGLTRLAPLTRDVCRLATADSLALVLPHVGDTSSGLRHPALRAAYCLLRANPSLGADPATRAKLQCVVPDACGFAETMAQTPLGESLLLRVTLGGKLGAGTLEKKLAPVTSDPAELAAWIAENRPPSGTHAEVQVSIGFDTGPLPSLEERARFLGLYLFITTTDLDHFQALLRRPHRDPNAAFGLVIRGDIIEPRYPGQHSGHRLDYVFPLPEQLSQANLAGLFRQLQLLNLGLLCTCVAEVSRVFFGSTPPYLDARRSSLARQYAEFERRFVRLLRAFDAHRDPERIHALDEADHAERIHAFAHYRLEECLYPPYHWIVPLYSLDTRWDRLLEPLRAVEGMLLHQGAVEGCDLTRGSDFIRRVRGLGYETAEALADALTAETPAIPPAGPPDPFIDPNDEDATLNYLHRTSRALALGVLQPEDLPDPATFRQAAKYYGIPLESPRTRPE